jgi:bacillolysin
MSFRFRLAAGLAAVAALAGGVNAVLSQPSLPFTVDRPFPAASIRQAPPAAQPTGGAAPSAPLAGKKPTGVAAGLVRPADARMADVNRQIELARALDRSVPARAATMRHVAGVEAARQLSALAATSPKLDIVWDDETGTPRHLNGLSLARPGSGPAADAEGVARGFLRDYAELVELANPDAELATVRVETDAAGFRAVRFEQTWQGRPIWGHDVIVRLDPDGRIIGMTGHYRATPAGPAPAFALDGAAAAEQALEAARNAHGRGRVTTDAAETWFAAGERLRPAHAVIVEDGLDFRRQLFIDAVTGEVLKDLTLVHHDGPANGSGLDLTNTSRALGLYEIGGTFLMTSTQKSMFDAQKSMFPNAPSGTITLINAGNGMGDNMTHVTSGNANSWTNFRNAVSGQHFAGQVYDYYLARHNRQSIDGNKGTMWLVVNFDSNYNNAFWNGQFMVFGNGDGNAFSDLAGALDVTAHEMSHGVIENTANLVYEFQPGALNEHFADVFGAATEFFVKGAGGNWLLGEDVTTPGTAGDALRDMEQPDGPKVAFGGQQPAHMNQFQNLPMNQDNGGVHINSGIPNRAFFLASTAVGIEKTERIWYRALSQYLSRNSQFVDFRIACVNAATDLFGGGSAEVTAVTNAMNAVGIVAGQATPPPPPAPQNPGTGFVSVIDQVDGRIVAVPPDFSTDPVTLSPNVVGAGGRPSFADDGSAMVWVGSDANVYHLDVQGGQVTPLSNEGGWWSVGLSPTGQFLTVTTVEEDGRIYIFDLFDSNNSGFFDLTTQNSTTGSVPDQVVFADVLEWTIDGQFVVYDALNRSMLGGQTFEFWDINLLRLEDGACFRVFQPLPPGESIGNPAFAQNSDNKLAFDYASLDGNIYVLGYDFQSGALGTITNNLQSVGRPTFSGNDAEVFYQFDPGSGDVQLLRVGLLPDGVTGAGNDALWATGGFWPVWFTVGQRPTPARLLAFDVLWVGETLQVEWHVAEPEEFAGFLLSRSVSAEGPFEDAGTGVISVDAGRDDRWSVTPAVPEEANELWFRLDGLGRDGSRTALGTVHATRQSFDASRVAFLPVSPNPVRGAARLSFVLPEGAAGPVRMTVFDAAGRRVARPLEDVVFGAGAHGLTWNATDDGGAPVPAGVYFVRFEAGRSVETRRLVVAR